LPSDLFSRAESSADLQGTLERFVYTGAESGWSVARLRIAGRSEPVTIVGNLTGVQAGEMLQVRGVWEHDSRYGRQFRVQSYRSARPATPDAIARYLGSGLVPGIGPVTARRIVDHFKEKTLDVLDDSPGLLLEVPGLGRKRATALRKAWQEQRQLKEVVMFLHQQGLGTAEALRIFKTYGARSVALVTENPYQLAQDIPGVGFRSADRIAQTLGIAGDAPRRIEAGVLYALEDAENQGHCFLPRERLRERVRALLAPPETASGPAAATTRSEPATAAPEPKGTDGELRKTVPETTPAAAQFEVRDSHVDAAIDALGARSAVVLEPDVSACPVYLRGMHEMEVSCVRALERLVGAPAPRLDGDPAGAIRTFESRSGLQLSSSQREALVGALGTHVLVLTGGPGTGKTTLVRALLDILGGRRRVVLAAPTGRAAKRLAEATRIPASTLHRLLEWNPGTHRFERDAEHRLEGDAFIVDETSMVDLPLFDHLLQALPPRARLFLVGDVDQLPSVGPGAVLADIIASKRVPTMRLNEIFRQEAGSLIVHNAHRIRDGKSPDLPARGERADFVLIEREEPAAIVETLRLLLGRRLPEALGADPRTDIQVLVPMNRGTLGTAALNRELQQLLNPDGTPIRSSGLRVGDKVMQVRNNYDLDVFNGDIGRIEALDDASGRVRVHFEDRGATYAPADLDQLVPAYACTVHKSQGSEYPVVVLVLHPQHHVMLQRNLLYTAVTRAKQQLVILGQRRALNTAVHNARRLKRWTRLADRLEDRGPTG
jgi:exodeoxyribonuclease V alpha subunit